MAGRGRAGTGPALRVVHDVAADPSIDELDPLFGDALVVEPHRQPGRVAPVIRDRHQVAADPLARLEEAPLLLDGEGGEAKVAEHVEEVDDCVLLEDDRVIAGLERDGVGGRPCLVGRLPPDGGRVDGSGVHGRGFRVAGAAARSHGNGDQLGGRPRAADPGTPGIRHRGRLRARGERAVGDDPGGVGGGDHGAGTVGAKFGTGLVGGLAVGGRDRTHLGRAGEAAPVVELLHDPGDGHRVLGQAAQAFRVGSTGRGDADPLADDHPQVDHDVGLGHVLVDLAVCEASQCRILGHDQGLRFRHAMAHRLREDGFGQGQRVMRSIVVHRRGARQAYHLPTPTLTFRKRAPGTAWPTWPVCPGSPLPQFGVPSMT